MSIDRTEPIVFVQEAGQPSPPEVTLHMTYGYPNWVVGSFATWLISDYDKNSSSPVTVEVGLNDAFVKTLAQGHYSTQLGFQQYQTNGTLSNTIQLPVTLVIPHSFGLKHSDLEIAQGQTGTTAAVHVALQADTVRWSATTSASWLAIDQTSGTGSTSLGFSVSDATLAPGVHDATVTVTDLDYNVSESMTVTVHVEPRTLVTRAHGVGLTSAPGWSQLTASIAVTDSAGLPSTWSASSDQPWLILDTPSGNSGSSMTLHADPTGLTEGMHYAQVTLTPTTAGVSDTQSVRVGLYVSSSIPSSSVPVDTYFAPAACDTTRPYCYMFGNAGLIVFNVLSGQTVATIPVSGFTAALSSDAKTLYVASNSPQQIVPVDLDTMTVLPALASSDVPALNGAGTTYSLAFAEIGGRQVLVTNEMHILDASTGQTLRDFSALLPAPLSLHGPAFGISHDGRTLAVRSQDNAMLYRLEIDTDGSFTVGLSEVHQESVLTSALAIKFLGDDSGFFCLSDQLRRYSSGNLGMSSIVAGESVAFAPIRDSANYYLFTPAVEAIDGNSYTPGVIELRGADDATLQTLQTPFAPTISQALFISADQHRLDLFTEPIGLVNRAVDVVDLP